MPLSRTRAPSAGGSGGDSSGGVVAPAAGAHLLLGAFAGAISALAAHWLAAALRLSQWFAACDVLVVTPVCLGALILGLQSCPSGWLRVPTIPVIVAVGLGLAYAWAESVGSIPPVAAAQLLLACSAAAALGVFAGWSLARRLARCRTWPRSVGLVLGCSLASAAVLLSAAAEATSAPSPPARASVPLGLPWASCAVLVASTTRLPQPVLATAAVALISAAGCAAVAGIYGHKWVPGYWWATPVCVLATIGPGLLLQAAFEARDTPSGHGPHRLPAR